MENRTNKRVVVLEAAKLAVFGLSMFENPGADLRSELLRSRPCRHMNLEGILLPGRNSRGGARRCPAL